MCARQQWCVRFFNVNCPACLCFMVRTFQAVMMNSSVVVLLAAEQQVCLCCR